MTTVGRKHDSIDLLKLYKNGKNSGWNELLTTMLEREDVSGLVKLHYGLQAGMTDLVKKKLDHYEIKEWFVRMQRSIEITLRKIHRKQNPTLLDNPIDAKNYLDQTQTKKLRDASFEEFLKKNRF